MEARKGTLLRTYLLYAFMCILGLVITIRVVSIQYFQGNKWKIAAANMTTSYYTIEAMRGNIYAADGNLLATSLPYYDIAMDVNTDYLSDDIFNAKIDSLSMCFAQLFKDKSVDEYYRILKSARASNDRYVLLKKSASYDQLQKVKHFPLLRLGRNKGGMIVEQTYKRELPFRDLAERTIGYTRDNINVGLEGAFDEYLRGDSGSVLMEKLAGGVKVPINNDEDVQPQNGEDVVSTININYQDVAETSLREQLIKHNADHGCVILMEVKTGRVLAAANLQRKDSTGKYEESYNFALGEAAEPGSTFKLSSLIVAMEDGYVNNSDSINLENGTHQYYDRVMRDAEHDETGWVTVQRAFEMSSNVGISKIVYKYYANQPKKFVDGLSRLGLDKPLNLSIPGEGTPKMPNPSDKSWSGVSLPWLAIGYGVDVTPLQTLTVYNSVANNGIMVKPRFVDALMKNGKVVRSFPTQVINPAICSATTLKKLRKLLEGVVLRGTAKNLNNTVYSIAGKTGTAQISNKGKYKTEGKINYQASFVGYFPANNPEYSCIVIMNSPSSDGYYGNITAGPIFREIADKVYASSINIDPSVNSLATNKHASPFVKNGSFKDIDNVLQSMGITFHSSANGTGWVNAELQDSTIHITADNPQKMLKQGIMPDLHGMSAEDAVYLLENNHLRVTVKGMGAVAEQSLPVGTKFIKGQRILLQLS
ncbi:MAG TPA: penicillin-binding protein [Bacteroidia bacterium]|nr:penicillin-binding protein [Bacteroidia bacterium]